MASPAPLSIRIPELHPAQAQVMAEARRFNVLACGRRWGKTTLAIDAIVKDALQGFPCGWFSARYKLLMEAWRTLEATLSPVLASRNGAEYRLELRGGGSLTMFSLDSDVAESVRGRAFKAVVVDEAALVSNLKSVWETSIRPTLTDHRGSAWFLSTPRGLNDFKLFFDRGQDSEQENWASWQMPTSTNPFLAEEEISDAREELSEMSFSQEYLALFCNWEGSVFRRILDALWEPPENTPCELISIDWARSHDFTVFMAFDEIGRMLDLDRFKNLDYHLQLARLRAFWERHNQAPVYGEENNMGGPLNAQLRMDGIPVYSLTTTNQSKAAAVEALMLGFERGEIRILNHPALISELQAFEGTRLPSGLMRYVAPEGRHDDTVLALLIGIAALGERYRERSSRTLYLNLEGPEMWSDYPQRKIISPV